MKAQLTGADVYELRALVAEVRAAELARENAELHLRIARAAQQERVYQIAASHGIDVTQPFDVRGDVIAQADVIAKAEPED